MKIKNLDAKPEGQISQRRGDRVKSEERAQHSGCCPESAMLCPYKEEGGRELGDAILWFGRSIGCVAKELQQAVSFGISGALLEKCGGGFDDSNFLGDGCGNPLVQGDAVFLREALGSLFDGMRQLQRISSPAHGFILFKKSAGVSTGTLKRAAAAEKSAVL